MLHFPLYLLSRNSRWNTETWNIWCCRQGKGSYFLSLPVSSFSYVESYWNPLTIYLLMLASPSPLSYFILMLGQSFVDTYAFACRVNVFKRSIDSFRDNSLRKAVAKGYAQQFKFLLECCHFNDAVILEEITGRRWVTWSRLHKITSYVLFEFYYLCYFL